MRPRMHASFIRVTCDVTHAYVCHASFTCSEPVLVSSWLIRRGHASFIVWQDSVVSFLVHMQCGCASVMSSWLTHKEAPLSLLLSFSLVLSLARSLSLVLSLPLARTFAFSLSLSLSLSLSCPDSWPMPRTASANDQATAHTINTHTPSTHTFHKTKHKSPVLYQKSLLCHQKSPVFDEKSPILYEQSPVFDEKSPWFYQKSPVLGDKSRLFYQKSPTVGHKSPIFCQKSLRFDDKEPFILSEEAIFIRSK